MATQRAALSISHTAMEWLREGPLHGDVLATFERAIALLIPNGEVIALVIPELGDGPLNVVVEDGQGFEGIEPGTPFTGTPEAIRLGTMEVALAAAAVWHPQPDWPQLRARRIPITGRLPALRAFCLEQAPAGSFLDLLAEHPARHPAHRATLSTAQQAAKRVRAAWKGNGGSLEEGAVQLAGLGTGLTPGGDDFLTGMMLWAWLAHPNPGTLCQTLVHTTAPRTTTVSAAFLRAAGRGECNAAWHKLIEALAEETDAEMKEATRAALAHGATSGADTLAGFLWTGLSDR